MQLYDSIGTTYGRTRRADPMVSAALSELVSARQGANFLDLACGTGNYTLALSGIAGNWHGIDASETMLKQAKARSSKIDWRLGHADALPYASDSFDGVISTLAIHHFSGLHQPFKEVYRVLHQGRFVLFTAFPKQMRGYWLCHYFPEMMQRAIKRMPTEAAITSTLAAAGFEIERVVSFCVTNQLQDLFLYSGKARPEQYFDPEVRANISSFASHCSSKELASGLQRLKLDIDTGEFSQVADRYRIGQGDYAYVVARKSR